MPLMEKDEPWSSKPPTRTMQASHDVTAKGRLDGEHVTETGDDETTPTPATRAQSHQPICVSPRLPPRQSSAMIYS